MLAAGAVSCTGCAGIIAADASAGRDQSAAFIGIINEFGTASFWI